MQNTLSPLDRAIKALCGPIGLAKAIGLRNYQSVQGWKQKKVPAGHCPAIERATRAVGQPVLCEELRPDVDWVVLRQNAVAEKAVA